MIVNLSILNALVTRILIGDFNLTKKLENLISSFSDWKVLSLTGSTTSLRKINRSSDIGHALVNDKMLKLLSNNSFINFPPILDQKPFLIYSNSFSHDVSFLTLLYYNILLNDDNRVMILRE